jgi:hypothetical protein
VSRATIPIPVLEFVVAVLIGLLIVVITSPTAAEAIRGAFEVVSSNRAEALATVIGTAIVVVGTIIAAIRWLRGGETTPTVRTVEAAAAPNDDLRRVRDEASRIARRIRVFTQERDEDDPFHREEILRNMDSPEYRALAARYDEHMDETLRMYRSDLLSEVVRVRDAFADLGTRDPELDRLHEDPRNYKDLRTLADRLIAMADTVSRQA